MIRKLIEKITSITRRESHEYIKPKKQTRQDMILELLTQVRQPITANEISKKLLELKLTPYFSRNFSQPRLNELSKDNRARTVNKRKCTITGRTCVTYEITEQGREYLMGKIKIGRAS
jgi:predicted ArsR family transcriptional regulator